MKFRYEFDIPKISFPINHQHKLLLIGSCFTENIGGKLKKYKFQIHENPHGILFNPVSVAGAIHDYICKKEYQKEELFYYNEGWHSWQHHSRFSGLTADDSINKINHAIAAANDFLKQTDFLLVTLGSAWVYKVTRNAANWKENSVAANNHKAPSDWFERELLAHTAVESLLTTMLKDVVEFNPNTKVIFTISPVRHLREGAIDNNRSKAVLIHAVHSVANKFDHVYYFPAYELVLDDLRDYRFYAEDLVHPNYFATEYVWKRFVQACMNDDTQKLTSEIHAINLAFQHKPFNSTSGQHKQFLNSFLKKTTELQQKHPFLNFTKELEYFSSGI